MSRIIDFSKSNKTLIMISALWILLWIIPWGKFLTVNGSIYLVFLVDMIRLGMSIGLFIIPGVLLYWLLGNESGIPADSCGLIPIGFAFSVTIIAVIGFTGRVAGFSFAIVKSLFVLIGLLEIMFLMIIRPDFVVSRERFFASIKSIFSNAPLMLALVLAGLMTFNDHLFFVDDLSYLAFLTNWQHSTHLGFENIVHEASVMENVRYWMAMYPMGQALLANLSGVPGILLLGNYLELFLVPIAIITSYWFARILGLSRRAAGFSTLIQVSFYSWMIGPSWPVGTWFFQSMAEDKVTAVFLLSPVLFYFILSFLQFPTKRNLILVFISGLGLTFSHPIILFFSCLITFGIALFFWWTRSANWRVILQLFIALLASMLPYIVIRFSNIPLKMGMPFSAEAASATFQVERYLNVINDVFYGLNPDVLKFFDIPPEINGYSAFQVFRLAPIILVVSAGIYSLFKLRNGALYWYIFTTVLIIFFATLPYTGWILGYFVTARIIPRISWYSPIGLSGALVLKLVQDRLRYLNIIDKAGGLLLFKKLRLTVDFLGGAICFAFVLPVLFVSLLYQAPLYFEHLKHYRQLAQVGAYIDGNAKDKTTSISLDYLDTQFLPGVSARTVLISFREETEWNGFNNYLTLDEIRARNYAGNVIRSLEDAAISQERCSFMRQFDLRYVLAQHTNADIFKNSVRECNIAADRIFETDDLVLLEIKYASLP